MRTAPLAFFLDPSLDTDRVVLRDVCRITHHHEEAYVGALAVVVAVRMAAFEGRLAGAAEVASRLPDSVVRDRLSLPLDEIGTSGYVGDTVPRAIGVAARLPDLGFEGVLEQILGDGGDTDTIGSIAGQIMGASLGLGGLPGRLVDQLPERDLVLSIARSVPLGGS
jgi:ADP-ribosyl-[dinitrogen reductase] hydrolase